MVYISTTWFRLVRVGMNHKGWIEEYLGSGLNIRQGEWTESIAVGSKTFIEKMKALLGFRAIGRDVIEGGDGYQLRQGNVPYKALFGPEKDNMVLKILISGTLIMSNQPVVVARPQRPKQRGHQRGQPA